MPRSNTSASPIKRLQRLAERLICEVVSPADGWSAVVGYDHDEEYTVELARTPGHGDPVGPVYRQTYLVFAVRLSSDGDYLLSVQGPGETAPFGNRFKSAHDLLSAVSLALKTARATADWLELEWTENDISAYYARQLADAAVTTLN